MIALRHKQTRALAIVPEANLKVFLDAGYIPVKGQDKEEPAQEVKPKRTRKKKVTEDATDADGSMQ